MEDTQASFLEDEIRQCADRIHALESAIREALTVLPFANYPEYSARRVAGEVADLLRKVLEQKEQGE